jgi:thioredoxin
MKPIELTDQTFEGEIRKRGIVVVDFWASWCAPCRFLSPIVEELAKDYDGKITFGKVDVDANQKVSSQYNITSIPTVIMFKDGKVADMSIGAVPKAMLESKLKKTVELDEIRYHHNRRSLRWLIGGNLHFTTGYENSRGDKGHWRSGTFNQRDSELSRI